MRGAPLVIVVGLAGCSVFGASSSTPDTSDAGTDAPSGVFSGAATTVAQAKQAVSITTDADNVYWADKAGGTIMSVARTGGEPRALATPGHQPDYVSVSGDAIYWLSTEPGCHDHLLQQKKSSTLPPTAIWPDDRMCYGTYRMAFAAGLYFYVQQDGSIVQVDPTNGNRNALADKETVISGMAGDGLAVFWTGDKQIRTVKQPGTGATTFVAGLVSPADIVVDESTVYWIDSTEGSIQKLERAKPQTLPTKLASGEMGAARLAVDATDLYWTSSDAGTVKAVAKAGGAVRTLAQGEKGPFAIAVDATGLFWSNLGDGTIRSLRR